MHGTLYIHIRGLKFFPSLCLLSCPKLYSFVGQDRAEVIHQWRICRLFRQLHSGRTWRRSTWRWWCLSTLMGVRGRSRSPCPISGVGNHTCLPTISPVNLSSWCKERDYPRPGRGLWTARFQIQPVPSRLWASSGLDRPVARARITILNLTLHLLLC